MLKVIYNPGTTRDDFTEEWNFLDSDLLSQVMEPFIREGAEYNWIIIPSEQAAHADLQTPRVFKPVGDRPILAISKGRAYDILSQIYAIVRRQENCKPKISKSSWKFRYTAISKSESAEIQVELHKTEKA